MKYITLVGWILSLSLSYEVLSENCEAKFSNQQFISNGNHVPHLVKVEKISPRQLKSLNKRYRVSDIRKIKPDLDGSEFKINESGKACNSCGTAITRESYTQYYPLKIKYIFWF